MSYDFPYGRATCVMGESGAGKTTLLRLLMGLEQPDGGSVEGFLECSMSAVFQEDRLCMNLNAESNVRLCCPKERRGEIVPLLDALGLGGSTAEPVSLLSGGMRRRVAIARALLAQYDVLLLDEPFRGLDAHTRDTVADKLLDMTRGKTVICVTHDELDAQRLNAQILRL